jgi:hypothetical protein
MKTDARPIRIEGYTVDEVLALPAKDIESLVFTGEPFVFQAGTATILGEFRLVQDRLTVELAQIEGGGEGVLPTLWILAERYAKQRGLGEVEWIVHAVHCAKPNPKLRRVLERRRFEVREVEDGVTAYYYLDVLKE